MLSLSKISDGEIRDPRSRVNPVESEEMFFKIRAYFGYLRI
ncbi:MAG: hypothetical protein MjAS7_1901 [Metallosphaera javensis (ex Sakai et al. 2022)]|nr:MAG: hypothetical protein MjAS7_1901 [Metallosphaera javensis (ex Sakai et al. 2022)]